MTENGMLLQKRDAFLDFANGKKWNPGNREIEYAFTYGGTQGSGITVVMKKGTDNEDAISMPFEEFLHKNNLKESDFYTASE